MSSQEPEEASTPRPSERAEVAREATIMVLYVSIVLLATFAALPAGDDGHAAGEVHGRTLIALVWGTALGLALAHWFAFRLAARLFGGGTVREVDFQIGLAQLVGAAVVALLCTIPILLVDDESDVQAAAFVPALIVGVVGFLVARVAGRSTRTSIVVGILVLLAGLLVAATKNVLAGH
jgi:FtsH-binding integral membrane protein